MKTDTVLLCYRGGFLGWLLVNAVISVPRFLWAGVGWVASYEAELYWWFLASGWFFVVAAHYTISSLWLDRHARLCVAQMANAVQHCVAFALSDCSAGGAGVDAQHDCAICACRRRLWRGEWSVVRCNAAGGVASGAGGSQCGSTRRKSVCACAVFAL